MNEDSIKIGKDVVSELMDIDFSKIAINDLLGYITTFGKNLVVAVIVYFVGRFIIKYLMKAMKVVTVKRKVEPSLVTFLNSLVSISLNLLLIVVIIGVLGIDTSSFLALFASAGLAIGMALSGTLQNFAGGVLILVLKPYRIGDFIEAQGFGGIVREIQIFNTVMTTPDNQTIIIPNGVLATGILKNSTKAAVRRVDIDVEVAYGTNPDDVRKVLNELVDTDERIINEGVYVPFIPMTTMAASSIIFSFRIWVAAENYWNVKFDMTEKVYKELTKAGIKIPFQQVDVHVKND